MADAAWFLPVAGVAAGIVIGAVARNVHFCTLSALERHWYANDSSGLRTWVLFAAVAIALTQAMSLAGAIDVGPSFYLTPEFSWAGAILGGIAFGFGMALVGTCGFGALVRLGGGSLRSLVALIILGLAALATQRGLLALARTRIADETAIDLGFAGNQSLGGLISALAGFDARAVTALAVVAVLLAWVFSDRRYRTNYRSIGAAVTMGGVIAGGWLATSWASGHSLYPVQLEAGSFVVPVGDVLFHLATFTGALPDYGVGLVIGVPLGAAAVAFRRHDVRWEACDDARELGRHIGGAALMGIGGVLAMGCTVGQGVTAASVLAISAPLVMISIGVGARLGLAYLVEGSAWAAFRLPAQEPAKQG
ncbi:YeeE/YedE family protein [Shumkonia mesophila]|uniref:YeeE/YedE family protein n=1 Tax=Shumkonia mesophila TaxID=2838854 RepID=UPI002934F663|nr:YeeE/YedE family protein [Shumkonia mesophila]